MKTGRNNNNKGFSLVELIVVVAVLAVVVSIAGLSLANISNKRATKCADEMIALMERTRVLTLGKAQNAVECVIYYDSASETYRAALYQGSTAVSERELGKQPLEVTVYFDNESAGHKLEDISGIAPARTTAGLHVMFDRASGAFIEGINSVGGAKKYCTKIVVKGGNRTIEILPVGKTGKISRK